MYYNKTNTYITNDRQTLFDLNKYDIYQLDNETFENFESLYNSNCPKEILDNDNLKMIYDNLFTFNGSKCLNKDNVTQIRIHTSNKCNLMCKYCYANYGGYEEEEIIMSRDMARKVAIFIKDKFPDVSTILFFGGEPLLGVDAIEEICSILDNNKIQYVINTNLTILNDRIINLINKYCMSITGSIDGPLEINDLNRLYKLNKCGTYNDIAKNIKELKLKTNALNALDATYTLDASKKYTKYEVAEYLSNTFGVEYLVVADVFSKDETNVICDKLENEVRERIDYLFENIINDKFTLIDEYSLPLTLFLSKSYKNNFCSSGISNITIKSNGDIWPCQLYIGSYDYNMGNILNFDDDIFNKVNTHLKNITKDTFDECNKCISKFCCVKCLGSHDKSNLLNEIISDKCNKSRRITEESLEKIGHILKIGQFTKLYNNLNKISKNTKLAIEEY